MDTHVFFIVLLASIMHISWNGMVKKYPDKVVALSGIVFGRVPCALVAVIFLPAPSMESVPYIIGSAFIHQGYQWYLLTAYQLGDLTKVYPIARGFGPIVVTIISIIFLGLTIHNLAIFSILLICLGIMFVGVFDYDAFKNLNILKYSLLTGFFIGLYSLVDGYGARISLSTVTYMSWSFVLSSLMFSILLKIKKYKYVFKKIMNEGKQIFLIGGTLSYVIYIIVVWGFTQAPIPMVAALRESSIFFSIIIGYLFLKERITSMKIISIILIVTGVVGLKLV
jgi:drug/metabolite transporter (DMT)-like permease|tara:strand:- start:578 stop:1420 length:843 start_codon:yes stop_codon:yes gene_type:complete